MDKKLNAEQIERLYLFTRQHFVEYFDLQTELVDHLANAIETKWTAQPELDFEPALKQEFKKFGVFGFMDVVEKRQAALTKRYYKLRWQYFKEFFGLPKLVLTLACIAITYQLLMFEPLLYTIILFTLLLLSAVKLFHLSRHYKKKIKQTGKKWLMEDLIFRCGGTGIYLYIAVQALRLGGEAASPLFVAALSVFLVMLALYDYIVLFIIPAKAEEHLKATYPEYNLEITL
jgi:hypothetical protein